MCSVGNIILNCFGVCTIYFNNYFNLFFEQVLKLQPNIALQWNISLVASCLTMYLRDVVCLKRKQEKCSPRLSEQLSTVMR